MQDSLFRVSGYGMCICMHVYMCVCVCVCKCVSGVQGEDMALRFSLLSFALGVCGLEDTGGRHEVLDVLTQDLVL